jgi:hypothetical protein
MRAEIYDKKGSFIRAIGGDYSESSSSIIYKTYGFEFWFIHLFPTENKFKIDYSETLSTDKGKLGIFIFDGKEYHQVPVISGELSPEAIKAYISDFKQTELAKKLTLDQPKDNFKDILNILTIIAIILSCFISSMSINNAANELHMQHGDTMNAINLTRQSNIQLMNLTNRSINVYNSVLQNQRQLINLLQVQR